jgi:hypothetical protein
MAMMSSSENEKDPSMLLSQETYVRILHLIGVSADNTGLAPKQVRLWTCPSKNHGEWRATLASVKKALFADNDAIVLAEVSTRKRMFGRSRRLVLMHDSRAEVDIVLAGVSDALSEELQSLCQTRYAHRTALSDKYFDMFLSLVENNACSHAQFVGMLGGGKLRYSWTDVQAAAQQFNMQPDDLIVMISERVGSAKPASHIEPERLTPEHKLSLVVDSPQGAQPQPMSEDNPSPIGSQLIFGTRMAAM